MVRVKVRVMAMVMVKARVGPNTIKYVLCRIHRCL